MVSRLQFFMGKLRSRDLAVNLAGIEQFAMRAETDDSSFVQDQDPMSKT